MKFLEIFFFFFVLTLGSWRNRCQGDDLNRSSHFLCVSQLNRHLSLDPWTLVTRHTRYRLLLQAGLPRGDAHVEALGPAPSLPTPLQHGPVRDLQPLVFSSCPFPFWAFPTLVMPVLSFQHRQSWIRPFDAATPNLLWKLIDELLQPSFSNGEYANSLPHSLKLRFIKQLTWMLVNVVVSPLPDIMKNQETPENFLDPLCLV